MTTHDLDQLEAELDRAAAEQQQRLARTQQTAAGSSAGRAGGAGADQAEQPLEPRYAALEQWVDELFCPTFPRRSSPTFSWCAQWWRHPEAIVRLEALWRSWETLRLDPLLGMASWLTGHLDPQLAVLTGPAGPFAGCDPTRHFAPDPTRLAHTAAPADWWPPDGDSTP